MVQSSVAPNSRRLPESLIRQIEYLSKPLVAITLTVGLLAVFGWGIAALHAVLPASSRYTNLYLIPVAIAGGLLGLRGGYVTMLVALILERSLLDSTTTGTFASADDVFLFVALALSMFIVASITGCLNLAFRDLQRLHNRLSESEHRRSAFTREVLLAVTSGRLVLCDRAELYAMAPGASIFTMPLRESRDVGELRHHATNILERFPDSQYRPADIEISATEAATNAIKHGRGGRAEIRANDREISILIIDRGEGIAPADLARATLERGFSTRVSLGMGFTLMLETADQLVMSTSDEGTTLLLRSFNRPRAELTAGLFSRFESHGNASIEQPRTSD